jgi:hypothetical protein
MEVWRHAVLRLLDAMTLRDGDTTIVALEDEAGKRVTYTFDYSLPWDGRLRCIRQQNSDGSSCELEPNGIREAAACESVRSLLLSAFGESTVRNFALGRTDNPGKDKWFYAFNFLRLAAKEGKLVGAA